MSDRRLASTNYLGIQGPSANGGDISRRALRRGCQLWESFPGANSSVPVSAKPVYTSIAAKSHVRPNWELFARYVPV